MRIRLVLSILGLIFGMTIAGCSSSSSGGKGGDDASGDGGGTDTINTDTGQADYLPSDNHPFTFAQEGSPVQDGGEWFTPLNAPGNTVALFSEQRDLFTINNTSDETVVINSITLVGQGDAADEEWRLQTLDLIPTVLEVSDHSLQPGERLDFYPRFYPVVGQEREAILTVNYDDGSSYQITIRGQGAPESSFLSAGDRDIANVFGRRVDDEQFGAMGADGDGNVYFSGNHETADDRIIIGRMNADGSLAWAKVFDGPYSDRALDPGQNSETGGGADSLAWGADGYLYAIGNYSWTSSNNSFYSWVAKIDGSDGSLEWSKLWSSEGTISIAREASVVYAVDAAASDRVFITGGTEGESQVLIAALDNSDGSVIWGRKIELSEGFNDRAYSVRYAGGGVVYLGGQTSGNAGFVARLTGADGTEPELDWARRIELGTGGNVNSMDIDDNGNVYAVFDIRGANSTFAFGSLDSTGALRWAKNYAGNAGDKNNAHVIRYWGDSVFVGGRTGQSAFDGQMGDGLFSFVEPATGEEQWSSFHFNGKGPDELTEHRVKGAALVGDTLYLGIQVYTGTMNSVRYWGYWYDGPATVDDFASGPEVGTLEGTMTLLGSDDGTSNGVAIDVDSDSDLAADWGDADELIWQTAQEKGDGTPPDADLMLWTITLDN